MLTQLPPILIYLLLAILGSATGAWINWAIYELAIFNKRKLSPWQHSSDSGGSVSERIPIIGWLSLRNRRQGQGHGFWIRPLLIEIAWAIALPAFWYWHTSLGLTAGTTVPLTTVEIWFWGQAVLIALMFAATFIDFDEKTIPDAITIPGVLIGLSLAVAAPEFRLPSVTMNLGGATVDAIHFASPKGLPTWHVGWIGLTVGLAIWTIWIVALVPKLIPLEGKLTERFNFMMASILRPARKTNPPLGNTKRGLRLFTKRLISLWIAGLIAIVVIWNSLGGSIRWDSFFSAVVGLAMGGGLIWGIRIIAGLALNQEAMGFGDVTLMAMIGAFLGWQAAFVAFALSPFAAIAIAVVNLVFRKESELAFGPYLCLGALLSILLWPTFWDMIRNQLTLLGFEWIAGVLLGAAVLMFPLLIIVRAIKDRLLPMDDEMSEDA